MGRSMNWNASSLLLLLPALMITLVIGISQTAFFQETPQALSNAILLDLLITIPLVHFLVIRKRAIPKITVLSLFVVGIILASFIIPAEQQFWLDKVKLILLPIAEVGILTFVGVQIYRTVRQFKQERNTTADFYTAVKKACKEVLPAGASKIAASEIAMIYYALFAWKKQTPVANSFSYHRKSGTPALLSAFIFIIIVEVFAIHILVQQWSHTAAWILSILSVYTCIQVLALVRALPKRLHIIDVENSELVLRFSFFSETKIPLHAIERIEQTASTLPEDGSIASLSPLAGLTPHNVILHLKETQQIEQLYGFDKEYQALAFYVDDKDAFVKTLDI